MKLVLNREIPINGYYVYVHRKLSNGEIFYIGKGINSRCVDIYGRSKYWEYVATKHGVVVEIIQEGLQEWYAYELEVELIRGYGRKDNGTGKLINLCEGGPGSTGKKYSVSERKNVSRRTKGNNNPSSDKKEYEFLHLETGEFFKGTRIDFQDKYGLVIKDLFKKSNVLVMHGWTTRGKDLSRLKADFNTYIFQHRSGEVFVGTRAKFKEEKGFQICRLFDSEHKYNHYRGWSVNLNPHRNMMTFEMLDLIISVS